MTCGLKAQRKGTERRREMKNLDQFIFSVIDLAFALKRLVESAYYDEGRYKLVQDFTRLKNRVQVHTTILEQKETAEKFRHRQQGLF